MPKRRVRTKFRFDREKRNLLYERGVYSMNKIKMFANHIRYAYHRKARDICQRQTIKHVCDDKGRDFKYWAEKWLQHTRKCLEIPLH